MANQNVSVIRISKSQLREASSQKSNNFPSLNSSWNNQQDTKVNETATIRRLSKSHVSLTRKSMETRPSHVPSKLSLSTIYPQQSKEDRATTRRQSYGQWQMEKRTKQKRRRFLPGTFPRACCLLCCAVGLALLLGLIGFLIVNSMKKSPTTTTTTTTSTTTTSVTTTTTTSTTSTTTTTTQTTTTTTATTTTTTTTQTTTTTTTTVTTTGCLSSYTGNLATHDGGTAFGWTQFAESYVANTTQLYLSFGFENDNHRTFWLDGVSIVDVTVPSGQLLDNPSFENSTSAITGWTVQQGCCNSNAAQITTTGCISGSNCLEFFCGPELTFSFIGQYFNATVGHTYNISYYLTTSGSGGQPTYCAVSIL